MGSYSSKCYSQDYDSANVTFQNQLKNNQTQGKINSDKDEKGYNSFQKTKATATVKIRKDFIRFESKRNLNSNTTFLKSFSTKLASIHRGRRLRNLFKTKLRQNLLEDSKNYIQKKLEGYDLNVLERAESNRKKKYSNNGWREFYTDNPDFVNVDYGKTYFTRIFTKNATEFYKGQVNEKNEKHGFGILITSNGEQYEGYFFHNKKSGWGEFIDKDSNIFQGLFRNDSLNGKGEKFAFNGDYYKGEFNNFQKHGDGFEETNTYKYTGNFWCDKKHSKGKIEYKHNNDIYEGEFIDDALTGTGIYRWNNGDVFKGSFVNGKMHGKGVYKWTDGAEYEGNYIENIKIGQGKFKWSNGKVYLGPFVNGKQHGNGRIIYPDGTIKQYLFENGKLIKS